MRKKKKRLTILGNLVILGFFFFSFQKLLGLLILTEAKFWASGLFDPLILD